MGVERGVIVALLRYLEQRPYREVAEGVVALVAALRANPPAPSEPAGQTQP